MSFLPAVLDTTRLVVENASAVSFDHDRVRDVADDLARRQVPVTVYDCGRHLCGADPDVANFVLVLDTLNFSFWPDPGEARWIVTYQDRASNGYWALVAALRRALGEGVPVTNAAFLADLSRDSLTSILRGQGSIPLLEERVDALREVGRGLLARDNGQFVNTIARADHDAIRLAALLAAEYASFTDIASYRGQPVHFLKRAQICACDLFGASGGQAWGNLQALDQLTAFADYKVPQVLRQLGVLVYVDPLADCVDNLTPLPPGSEGEIEIRAGTIWGVEYLRLALAARGIIRRAFEIDWLLWELGQSLPPDTRPYHRTRTIFY